MDNWKALPVAGLEGLYSVSDVGRVRYDVGRRGVRRGDMVPPRRDLDGYSIVTLGAPADRKHRRTYRVARLVAAAFLGPAPFPGAQVNHKNGARADDSVENLEWVSAAENIRHAIAVLDRDYRGPRSASAALTDEQAVQLREKAAHGATFKDLARIYGISNVAVANIACGRTYVTSGGPISTPRDAAEKKRLRIPNHAPGVTSNRWKSRR